MSRGRCILWVSAMIAATTTAMGSIWIDLTDLSLSSDDRDSPAISALTLVHLVEDADIGQPRSTWMIPLIESTLAPYDRDALLWRHPLSGQMGYLSRPREIGVFMHVKGTDCEVRQLAEDTFEIRQGGALFRYVNWGLTMAAYDGGFWRLETDAADGSVTAEWVTKAGTKEYRFTRDHAGRLKEARDDTVATVLSYDCLGQLHSIHSETVVWTFTYLNRRLQTLALGENRRSCRWENMRPGIRASSFSDLSQIKDPVVSLQTYAHVPAQ
jgi:hypothetical protein